MPTYGAGAAATVRDVQGGPGWLPELELLSATAIRKYPDLIGAPLRRARLRLTQTRPVIRRLGLGSKQCTQLTLLLGNKHTDHLPAYLRHAHPTNIRNTFQPEQH